MKAVAQVLALLLLVGTASLAGSELASGITFNPETPTANGSVEIRVTGAAASSCGSPTLAPRIDRAVIRLDLDFNSNGSDPAPCAPGQDAAGTRPYTAATEVGPLEPGVYTVQVYAGGSIENAAVLEVARAGSAAAGLPGRSQLGMLAFILLLALAGAALLR